MKEKKIFSGQNDEEIIIKVLKRHPFTFIRDAIGSIFLFIASLVVMILFFYFPYVLPIAFIVFVFSTIGCFYSYFTWEKDIFVITDQRVVDVEQKTLFAKSQQEAVLDKIQDVSFSVKGFWGALFKYGTVNVQTASETSLSLDDISKPEEIQKIIFNLIKKFDDDSSEEENLMQKMTEMIRKALKEEQ